MLLKTFDRLGKSGIPRFFLLRIGGVLDGYAAPPSCSHAIYVCVFVCLCLLADNNDILGYSINYESKGRYTTA